MKNLNAILKLSALVTTVLVLGSLPSQAASCSKLGLSKAECACKTALVTGSPSALRSFLNKYPGADTACNAMASTAPIIEPDRNIDEGEARGATVRTSNGPQPNL